MKNSYRFFCNIECEYFPCHECGEGEREKFNCIFCYCPLYALGDKCGGNFSYIESGIKDCSLCRIPHSEGGYDYIIKKYPEIAKIAAERENKK